MNVFHREGMVAGNFQRHKLEPAFEFAIHTACAVEYARSMTVIMPSVQDFISCEQGWYHQTSVPFIGRRIFLAVKKL